MSEHPTEHLPERGDKGRALPLLCRLHLHDYAAPSPRVWELDPLLPAGMESLVNFRRCRRCGAGFRFCYGSRPAPK